MANNKSGEKRIRINKRNRLRNRYYKTSVRTLTKLFCKNLKLSEIEQNPKLKQETKVILNSVYSFLDKGTKRKVFHKNTVARQKAKLARQFYVNR